MGCFSCPGTARAGPSRLRLRSWSLSVQSGLRAALWLTSSCWPWAPRLPRPGGLPLSPTARSPCIGLWLLSQHLHHAGRAGDPECELHPLALAHTHPHSHASGPSRAAGQPSRPQLIQMCPRPNHLHPLHTRTPFSSTSMFGCSGGRRASPCTAVDMPVCLPGLDLLY